jgi:butyrate kinase
VKPLRILVVNTGSTSTKIAVYDDERELFLENIKHSNEECERYTTVIDQYSFRISMILALIEKHGIPLASLDVVVGRGGILKPIHGGVWKVTRKMLDDLHDTRTAQHASNLSGIIAYEIAAKIGVPSYIVDPVVVNEMEPIATYSGIPQIVRRSVFHALNQKATARRAARELGKAYEEVNLIVAHMGGGITVGAHRKGRVVDVNNGLNGDGPFAPERAGTLPAGQLVELCFHGGYTEEEIGKLLKGKGGLVAYCGTSDAREVYEKGKAGDAHCLEVIRAMAYQVGKEIGSMAAVLCGRIDGIVLTGGLAHNAEFISWITDMVGFLGRIFVYPGEDEMIALRDGALRVSRGLDTAEEYS